MSRRRSYRCNVVTASAVKKCHKVPFSFSSSGLCKPSVSHLATRAKKQKIYSDDEDDQADDAGLGTSRPMHDEEERNSDDEREASRAITVEELAQVCRAKCERRIPSGLFL